MVDLFLVMSLGFLGSFGHCVGMCGPIAVGFSLTERQGDSQPDGAESWAKKLVWHGLLNLGRLLSYTLVGAAIGAVGSVLIAGGQMAGIGSALRQGLTIFTGSLLIWFGLSQIKPGWLPHLPLLNPFGNLHQRLATHRLSQSSAGWTPLVLGSMWGLIPCGFLYAAQIKAAETGNLWLGAATMAAFGLGTVPSMLGVGLSIAKLSAGRRSQLFRLGGWITITIGVLTLLRTDGMVDYTGHAALILLVLALIGRPISHLWPQPLQYRRALGVGAFVLAIAHTGHMLDHTLQWQIGAIAYLLPQHQVGMGAGFLALILLIPAALTSFDRLQQRLGDRWRQIHLLAVPAFLLAVMHTVLIGSRYLGGLNWTWQHQLWTGGLVGTAIAVLLARSGLVWSILCLSKFYVSPTKPK
ncbi:MAG: sulfite exporter TauE/SafE family protein [Aphanocapsa sp. GSE-SYN-MK-11-07L]|jgi:hypothetical protein|nr:sulfite exporter TauE/SafE family protein [Aphanocapsa sp. GSE-SYN-MK-11-07L]